MILEVLLTISPDNPVRSCDFRDPSDEGTKTLIPTEQNNFPSTLSIVATIEDTFIYLFSADPVVEPTNEP